MKKRIVALLLVLVMAVCAFPVCAFADNPQAQPATTAAVSKPAQDLWFKDHNGNDYYVYSGRIISTTQNTSWTGYILVIQNVLYELYKEFSNDNFYPGRVDGIFGQNTKSAVVCFQVAYISANDADGVVGPTTWWYLYTQWILDLGACNLSYV